MSFHQVSVINTIFGLKSVIVDSNSCHFVLIESDVAFVYQQFKLDKDLSDEDDGLDDENELDDEDDGLDDENELDDEDDELDDEDDELDDEDDELNEESTGTILDTAIKHSTLSTSANFLPLSRFISKNLNKK